MARLSSADRSVSPPIINIPHDYNAAHDLIERTLSAGRGAKVGRYVHAGRNDDMLKVSGLHVSPVEVESALIAHPAVLEAAVVGKEDEARLIKPIAFVVLQPDQTPSPELADELKQHVKARLAMYKYPRWIDFVTELPKTVTGKIQRYKLRERAAQTTSGRAA